VRSSSGSRAASPFARLAWTACLPLVAGLCWICGRAFFAALYLSLSHEELDHSQEGPLSQQAAIISSQLAPWMPEAHSRYARNRAADGDTEHAVAAFGEAVRWAPGDAQLWRDMVRSLARSAHFDSTTRVALRRSRELAPFSPGIHLGNALDGVYFWRHGDEELHRLWLEDMRYTLLHTPRPFLRQVAQSEREALFCAYVEDQLPIGGWCKKAAFMREACARPKMAPKARQICRNTGFLPRPGAP
jgi:hypothetical protein